MNLSNYTSKPPRIDSYRYILSKLSYLLYLENHEPFNFALAKARVRKALKLTLTEFRTIYIAYKSERGAGND